ncbi:MAG: dTDP-4-amino-4,6-dideoxygalactose transaminase [Paracoccaceae bacterium]
MTDNFIPYSRSSPSKNEKKYLMQVCKTRHLHGGGPFTELVEKHLRTIFPHHRSFLTTSCSDALELAALSIDIQAGDEVIVPSFSFTSCANAFALRGAKIVFCDIDDTDFNINIDDLRSLITEKTRAIVCVNYASVPCNYDAIRQIVKGSNILIVEDNAHGYLASSNGNMLGTYGDLSVLSFHNTKNISAGEAGVLLMRDDAEETIEKASIIIEKGTNRKAFSRGIVDKYTWNLIGSSFVASELIAAVLLANLEEAEKKTGRRKLIWNEYFDIINSLDSPSFERPTYMLDHNHNGHIFPILATSKDMRDLLIARSLERNIQSTSHYQPLSSSPAALRYGFDRFCKNADSVADRIFRVPIFDDMSDEEMSRVHRFLAELK